MMTEKAFFFKQVVPRLRRCTSTKPIIAVQKHYNSIAASEERKVPRQNTKTPPQFYFGQGFIKATLAARAVKYKIGTAFNYQWEKTLRLFLKGATLVIKLVNNTFFPGNSRCCIFIS